MPSNTKLSRRELGVTPASNKKLKGYFIAIEGVDGCGKSTQAKELATWIKDEVGLPIYLSKEPGDLHTGSRIGKNIRSMVFNLDTYNTFGDGVADLLYLADHVQNQYDIAEHLVNNEVVICDRYSYSEVAFGNVASKRSSEWVLNMYRHCQFLVPDLVIYLKPIGQFNDISWCLKRANQRAGSEAGKQQGKQWNSIEEHYLIGQAYDDIFIPKESREPSYQPNTKLNSVYELPKQLLTVELTEDTAQDTTQIYIREAIREAVINTIEDRGKGLMTYHATEIKSGLQHPSRINPTS